MTKVMEIGITHINDDIFIHHKAFASFHRKKDIFGNAMAQNIWYKNHKNRK